MLMSSFRGGSSFGAPLGWGPRGGMRSHAFGLGQTALPPTVRQGSRGEPVKMLQQLLNTVGINAGTPDGVFGPKTTAAVKAFQKARGLTADGIVGPGTWRALGVGGAAAPAPSQAVAKTSSPPVPKAPPTAKPPAAKTAAATTLQVAVRELGKRANDAALVIAADGVIGPKTAAAVNRALTRYATTAPAALRTGNLSVAQIKEQAAPIAIAVEQAARAAKPTPSAKPVAAAPTKAAVQQMQTAIRNLGIATNDAALKIAVDGVVGPRTAAAASKAIGRQLSVADVKANVATITTQVQAALAQRSAVPQPSGVLAPTAAQPQAQAPTTNIPRTSVARLQRALSALGAVMGDRVLQIKADGISGPKTAAALNKAMQSYVRNAAPSMKRTFTSGEILSVADALATQVESELASRRAEAAKKSSIPEPTAVEETADEGEETQATVIPMTPQTAPQPGAQPAQYQPPEQYQPAQQYQPEQYAPNQQDPGYRQEAASEPAKKLPWGWIVGGTAGALVLGGLVVAAFSRRGERRERRERRDNRQLSPT